MLCCDFEIYVGNDPDYNNNVKCAGGPYLPFDSGFNDYETWPGGFEAWCNLEGEYVTILRGSVDPFIV